MKKRKTFIAMALVIAVLVLGVGYAAISNINLTVNAYSLQDFQQTPSLQLDYGNIQNKKVWS